MSLKVFASSSIAASVLFSAGFAHAQLSAPAPMDPNQVGQSQPVQQQPQTETQQTLQQSESEDSGRGLEFFYVNGGVDGTYVGMDSLSSSNFAVTRSNHVGPGFDLGLGLRLLIITIGPRLRFEPLSAFNFWQLDAEVALHIPISKLDISFGPHGGYAFATGLDTGPTTDVKVHGADLGLDVAVDYYLTPHFSLGVNGSASLFFLARPGLSSTTTAANAQDQAYAADGSSVGLGALVGLRAGLHF